MGCKLYHLAQDCAAEPLPSVAWCDDSPERRQCSSVVPALVADDRALQEIVEVHRKARRVPVPDKWNRVSDSDDVTVQIAKHKLKFGESRVKGIPVKSISMEQKLWPCGAI